MWSWQHPNVSKNMEENQDHFLSYPECMTRESTEKIRISDWLMKPSNMSSSKMSTIIRKSTRIWLFYVWNVRWIHEFFLHYKSPILFRYQKVNRQNHKNRQIHYNNKKSSNSQKSQKSPKLQKINKVTKIAKNRQIQRNRKNRQIHRNPKNHQIH